MAKELSEASLEFKAILDQLWNLHNTKNKDYGRDHDPYANVRGSKEWAVRPWIGAMVRANDKIKRLQKYAQDGVLANEGAEDSFLDLAVYSIIALILWREETRSGGFDVGIDYSGPSRVESGTTKPGAVTWGRGENEINKG